MRGVIGAAHSWTRHRYEDRTHGLVALTPSDFEALSVNALVAHPRRIGVEVLAGQYLYLLLASSMGWRRCCRAKLFAFVVARAICFARCSVDFAWATVPRTLAFPMVTGS